MYQPFKNINGIDNCDEKIASFPSKEQRGKIYKN